VHAQWDLGGARRSTLAPAALAVLLAFQPALRGRPRASMIDASCSSCSSTAKIVLPLAPPQPRGITVGESISATLSASSLCSELIGRFHWTKS
jgi:hypothetical protein